MIVFRYLIREVLKSQAAVLSVLLAIFISQQFVRILADASDGDFPASIVMKLIGLNMPELAGLILPLSLFLGILLAHGRMYAENEMVIFHSVGISEWYVARVMLLVAVFNCFVAAALSLYITPWAEEQKNIVLEKAKSEAGLAALIQGRFQASPNGRAVIFVEKIGKNNELERVFVAQQPDPEDDDGVANLVVAQGGRVTEDDAGGESLKLNDGVRYQGALHRKDFQIIEFGAYQTQIKEQEVDERDRKLSALSTAELLDNDTPEAVAEMQWRMAVPVAILLVTLIAVPLARVNVRQGKFAKLFPAILLYLGYFGLLVAGRKALQDEVIPLALGMWWIHGAALLIGVLLLSKERPLGVRLMGLLRRRGMAA
ncbi:LPS export ABC transporter permease LptF [Shewanella sp. A3A]|nr:LPS export ABC transporter permease LptF [Shewanella ferrihydritica]